MSRTVEKVILGVLVIAIFSISAILITGFDGGVKTQETVKISTEGNKILMVEDDIAEDQELEDENELEDESEDLPITGNALERANAAALAYIGEGRVTDTEVGDEEGYYEIEITKDNGGEVDVHLDENFNVLSKEDDEEEDD